MIETCPRCRAGEVVRVVSLRVCSECDWEAPRIAAAPPSSPPRAQSIAGRGQASAAKRIARTEVERQQLLAALQRGPATGLELARVTRIKSDRIRGVLAGWDRVDTRRRGPAIVYALAGEGSP